MAKIAVDTVPLVLDVGVVLLTAASMGYFARKLGLPSVIGYLVTGILVSPFTPGFVADRNQLSLLADIGVILLLFEVGIEINLKKIRGEQRVIFWGAPLQVLVGLLIGTPIFIALDFPTFGALLLALCIALSSSVVVVNITRSPRRKTNPLTEEAMLGWSVVQDLFGIAIAAFVLALFGTGERSVPAAILGIIGFVALAIITAKFLPKIFNSAKSEGDLFIILSVSIGLVLAALGTKIFGLPMALAAFIAGLAINQSEDTQAIREAILPFKDLFVVLFFVVIGTLIQPNQIPEAWRFMLLIVGLMIVLKTIPTWLIAKFGKLPVSVPQLAIGISQVGELSFVLGSIAYTQKVISESQYMGLLLAVMLSIVVSTIAVRQIKVSD